MGSLADPARPETPHIRWPAGWHETAAEKGPRRMAGKEASTGGIRGYRDIDLAPDDTTTGARTAEPAGSVTLGWSDADRLLPGAVPGIWFGYAPQSANRRCTTRRVDPSTVSP